MVFFYHLILMRKLVYPVAAIEHFHSHEKARLSCCCYTAFCIQSWGYDRLKISKYGRYLYKLFLVMNIFLLYLVCNVVSLVPSTVASLLLPPDLPISVPWRSSVGYACSSSFSCIDVPEIYCLSSILSILYLSCPTSWISMFPLLWHYSFL